jgi:hypothetical protein
MKVKMEDRDCLKTVCERLGVSYREGKHKVRFYSQTVNTEFSFQLKGWKYPCALTEEGVEFDNYNGAWGKPQQLHKFNQEYCKEIAEQELNAQGMYLQETEVEADGSLTLIYEG